MTPEPRTAAGAVGMATPAATGFDVVPSRTRRAAAVLWHLGLMAAVVAATWALGLGIVVAGLVGLLVLAGGALRALGRPRLGLWPVAVAALIGPARVGLPASTIELGLLLAATGAVALLGHAHLAAGGVAASGRGPARRSAPLALGALARTGVVLAAVGVAFLLLLSLPATRPLFTGERAAATVVWLLAGAGALVAAMVPMIGAGDGERSGEPGARRRRTP